MERPPPDRQESAIHEFSVVCPSVPFNDVLENLMKTYGESRNITEIVLKSLDRDKKWIETEKYADLLQAFFPLRKHRGFMARSFAEASEMRAHTTGYTLYEIADIFTEPWWKGDATDRAFNHTLAQNLRDAYVRRSGSDRSAFVIGVDRGDGMGPQIWIYRQKNHRILAEGNSYRTIRDLYEAWTEAQGLRIQRKRHQLGDKQVETLAKPVAGKMNEPIGTSTGSHYVNMAGLFSS